MAVDVCFMHLMFDFHRGFRLVGFLVWLWSMILCWPAYAAILHWLFDFSV